MAIKPVVGDYVRFTRAFINKQPEISVAWASRQRMFISSIDMRYISEQDMIDKKPMVLTALLLYPCKAHFSTERVPLDVLERVHVLLREPNIRVRPDLLRSQAERLLAKGIKVNR